MASCGFEVKSGPFYDLIGPNDQRLYLVWVWIHVWMHAFAGHSNDAQREAQHTRVRDGRGWGWGQWWMPVQTGKEMSVSFGVSASVRCLRFRLPIYHYLNISYEETSAWLLECASSLAVCTGRVCVCGIIYGKTTQLCHLANIWTSARHLTLKMEKEK